MLISRWQLQAGGTLDPGTLDPVTELRYTAHNKVAFTTFTPPPRQP